MKPSGSMSRSGKEGRPPRPRAAIRFAAANAAAVSLLTLQWEERESVERERENKKGDALGVLQAGAREEKGERACSQVRRVDVAPRIPIIACDSVHIHGVTDRAAIAHNLRYTLPMPTRREAVDHLSTNFPNALGLREDVVFHKVVCGKEAQTEAGREREG